MPVANGCLLYPWSLCLAVTTNPHASRLLDWTDAIGRWGAQTIPAGMSEQRHDQSKQVCLVQLDELDTHLHLCQNLPKTSRYKSLCLLPRRLRMQ